MSASLPSSRAWHGPVAASAPRSHAWLHWLLVALTAAAPLTLFAQDPGQRGDGFLFRRPLISLTVRGGYDRPSGSSEIYDFATKQLTLDRGDLAALGMQFDLGVRLADRLDLVFTGGGARRSQASEFRNFVDNNDQPIEQVTTLRRFPITAGVKFALTHPGQQIGKFAWIPSRLTPWVGIGGGAMQYAFRQAGDFVDFETLNVFAKTYQSKGWAPMAYANVGADLSLNARFALTGDIRYSAARATLDGAFVGFDKIDLSGAAATMGLTIRY